MNHLTNEECVEIVKILTTKVVIQTLHIFEHYKMINNGTNSPQSYDTKKSYERSSVQCELAMISAFDSIVSCMSSSTTWTLCSVLICNGSAGSAMSFVWRRMLRQGGYWMRGSAEVGEEDDLASVGKTKSRKPRHRLV